jgi:branched-chain amino acid transport system ATP-binding protein
MSEPVLQVRQLFAGYGRIGVVCGVSFDVAAGEVVTLIGSNGAGKSTLLKAISGLISPSAGTAVLDAAIVTGTAPELLVRAGLALVPEGRMLFGPMNVRENLMLGAHTERSAAVIVQRLERVHALFPVLAERAEQPAATLSGGEQQMLAVGRALMSGPHVLLLDEPSLGLAPKVISEIFSVLDALRAEGLAVLLVEQDANLALKHADRGLVMRTGRVVLEGQAADLALDEDVRLAYLGAWHGKE